ncbi:hypothetical protein AUJ14_06315 [Candidatus Micrarchaeota archaeon CG1_02_55_22]|nr:MAG: hypothetical protein AUJ14_06315 [Candidatus Micrarchaeota archaeon CG1_02_55_22]
MKIIDSIEFGLYSPEQIRKLSTIKVTVPDTYDEDGYPIPSGLMDQHLGVIDPGLKCKTDGNTMKNCTGFFGHIELVRPVLHVGFGRHIYQMLKATCRKCSRLLDESSTIDKPRVISTCPHCGEKQGKVKFIKPTTFFEDERRLLPNEIRERLERVSDESLARLGVKVRPEWMVLTVLLVPPVNVRPSITLETGERSEDDLTHKLVDIIRINQRLGENIDAGAPQLIIEDLWELLQYHVTTFFDNETAGIPPARHRNGRQLKTLFQRLKGKEGRFRYNLSGKRVNFSARTVVSPDPTLGINELGVPTQIARELTVPVSVTPWNIENIKALIRDRMDKVNYIIRPDGKRKKLVDVNLEEVLAEIVAGYTVERQLMDGDIVVFNRQPSLHKVSMMAHRVRVLDGKTFRFNVADCAPYNADFDGDEMNIHVPQTEEAQAEAEILMNVGEQILSPRHGNPLIGPDYDQISGLYLMTQKGVNFTKEHAGNLLAAGGITKVEFKGSKISGRELYSMLLPEKMNFECKTRRFKKGAEVEDGKVVIKNGKMISGIVDSRSSDALLKHIFEEYGPVAASDYLDHITRISVLVATDFGLSLSLNDYKLSEKAVEAIHAQYKDARREVHKLVKKYKDGKLARQPGKTLRETLEEQVMDVVENVRNDAWDNVKKHINTSTVHYGESVIEFNPALMMSEAGARGKPINVIQMTALVGQQAVRGKRMRSGYKNRILPHYAKGDLGDAARGFVKSSYKHGLTPMEYFFHAAGGRDSVVDKGVNPAKTGYMQRRLINALQDLIVQPTLAVTDAEGRVVQFKYGDDGKNPSGKREAYGDPVGVIAAQSIGEPGTQMTLRTFHYAGVASLAQFGFTRLVEIIDATKAPKSPVMEVYLKKEYAKDYNKAKKVAAEIEQLQLGQIAVVKEHFDRKSIRVEWDEKALRERGIKVDELLEKIKDEAPFVKTQLGVTVKPKTDSIRNVRKVTTKLYEKTIRGVSGISRAIIIEKDGEYVLATEGSNLAAIMLREEVDAARTTTNDITEILNTLGVEAAHNSIINEMLKVLDAQGLRVDVRHIMLIADAMTAKGNVKSSGRHGMAGEKASVLARAAFEETAKHLINAAVKGEVDLLRGITENIIIGQTIPCGTGKVKLEMEA